MPGICLGTAPKAAAIDVHKLRDPRTGAELQSERFMTAFRRLHRPTADFKHVHGGMCFSGKFHMVRRRVEAREF